MRKLLIAMAGCIGVVSILLTARYGWKQADEEIDRWIAAVMFGSISLCAFVFDALAVRLWFVGWRKAGGFIGFIAALAFVVTFSNSLGGIVSRADTVQAQRQSVTDARADNRRELQRLEQALKDLGKFTPADAEAVAAAKRAADTATENRKAECDKRGPNCRQRELDEQAAATALREVTAHKATTDAAKRYEAQIGGVKAKLASPEGAAIAHANPLGNALALIIGTAADVLTARMQAIIALVFDLCLVGLMIGVEALGHVRASPASSDDTSPVARPIITIDPELKPARLRQVPRPKLVAASAEPLAGSIPKIMTAALEPATGKRSGAIRRSTQDDVGKEMRLIYSLDDGPKLTTTAVAVGKDQFVVRMTDSVALFQSFRRGRVLQFETQSGTIIPFNLTNSSRALDAALECAKRWMAQQGPTSPDARIYVPHATLRATAQAFLQEAGVSDYKFLPLEQGDPELAWEYSDRTRATFVIVRPEAKISMERALAQTIERDTAFCKGQYSSGYMAAKYHLGSEIRRLYTACSDPVKSFTFIYSVIQLPSGAIVRFGSSAKMSVSGTPETDTLPRTESIEAAGLRTVGARH